MSLNLPTPPTNNLYIFCAIFGLTVILASYIYVDTTESNARKKVMEISTYSSELIFEANNFSIGFESLSDSEKDKIRNKLVFNRAKFETLASEMMVYSRKYDESKIVKYIGTGIGALISAFGFILWYRRTQLAQDKLLDSQVSKPRVICK